MLTRHEFSSRLLTAPFYNDQLTQHDEEQRAQIERLEAEMMAVRAQCAQQGAELQNWRETARDVGEVDPHGLALHLTEIEEAVRAIITAWTNRYEIKSSIVREECIDRIIQQASDLLQKGAP